MKNIFRKLGVVMLAVSLMVPAVSALNVPASSVAEAATPKLSKTKLSIGIGKSKTLSVKNASGKVKWKSSDKNVAKVDSKGKVTGVTGGSCYITAKVDGQTLMCDVTVKFSESNAKKKISIKYDSTNTGHITVALVTNKNSYPVSISAKMIFYDSSGAALETRSDWDYCLGPKQTAALTFLHPYDDNAMKYIDPSTYKMSYNLESSYYADYSKKIKTSYDMGTNGVVATVKNGSNKKLDNITLKCLMYDSAGNLIGAEEGYAECYEAGSETYYTFTYPYDSNYNNIIPATAKIYVNSAYQYN